jgi:hypothetical protein
LLLLLPAGTPIVGLKILNSNGDGELSDVIDAMNWLLETRPNGTSSEPNPGGKTNAQVCGSSIMFCSDLLCKGLVLLCGSKQRCVEVNRLSPRVGHTPMTETTGSPDTALLLLSSAHVQYWHAHHCISSKTQTT